MRVSPIDRIGQRLDDPDSVPEELQHLIADDVARVEKILSIPVSGYVLDVGCSDGAITSRIRDRWGVSAIGMDARPDVFAEGPCSTLDFICHDIRQSIAERFTRGNIRLFDAIYACEVFEHLTDADAQLALTNILAVLKPGGDLIVSVPNRDVGSVYQAGMRDRWRWPDHRAWYDHPKLDAFLAPHFTALTYLPLDPRDRYLLGEDMLVDYSIWLIVHATGKR